MKPFLKFAGSKYRVVKYVKRIIGQFSGNRLVEPFVGSGTLFLNTSYEAYLLCDINENIINLYKNLTLSKKEFINYAKSFFTLENNQPAKYYYFRDLFNETKDDVLKSALFLYLSRHGYNGLVRYNKKGQFNVPFGRYEKPYFPEKEMLFF
ncbi:MAG TPA: Dam family site-specific DNA-(adenine-N6)-methyltransferase, partial [Thermodesulfobium narugense]|nr:Dam family site-specific DNA-(adenine-N6)-methyltransferase [Thermodesulfobium narugense]